MEKIEIIKRYFIENILVEDGKIKSISVVESDYSDESHILVRERITLCQKGDFSNVEKTSNIEIIRRDTVKIELGKELYAILKKLILDSRYEEEPYKDLTNYITVYGLV